MSRTGLSGTVNKPNQHQMTLVGSRWSILGSITVDYSHLNSIPSTCHLLSIAFSLNRFGTRSQPRHRAQGNNLASNHAKLIETLGRELEVGKKHITYPLHIRCISDVFPAWWDGWEQLHIVGREDRWKGEAAKAVTSWYEPWNETLIIFGDCREGHLDLQSRQYVGKWWQMYIGTIQKRVRTSRQAILMMGLLNRNKVPLPRNLLLANRRPWLWTQAGMEPPRLVCDTAVISTPGPRLVSRQLISAQVTEHKGVM